MAVGGRLRGWFRESLRGDQLDVTRSIWIEGTPETVWHLVWAPESALLLEDNVVECRTVPGTPRGELGEQQVHVWSIDGQRSETTIEVVELDPGRRAVVESVPRTGIWHTTSVASRNGETRLEVGQHCWEATIEPGWREAVIRMWEEDMDQYLLRVRDLVEGGWLAEQDSEA